jgi:hypothetical protein
MILPCLQTNSPVSRPRIKAEVLWRLRDCALLMRASWAPQILALSEEARGAPAASEQSERTQKSEWFKDQAQLGFSYFSNSPTEPAFLNTQKKTAD